MNPCTIVMYHYVRELQNSAYPAIKGLELADFHAQVEYMQQYYQFIEIDDLLAACQGVRPLPQRAALLTFDDGYSDHYRHVFPFLKSRGIRGFFFPPAAAIRDHRVLDVNKIHFILASAKTIDEILHAVFKGLDRLRSLGHDIPPNRALFEKLAQQRRFDSPKVVFIKRLLQRELDEAPRRHLVQELFHTYVTEDEQAFAKQLYVSMDELREMKNAGMVIGNHGCDHVWMNRLDAVAQERETREGLGFLDELGVDLKHWLMCYPYGGYNDSLTSICRGLGCAAGFTTQVDLASVCPASALTLPRLDTNHLPKKADGSPNDWTLQALCLARQVANASERDWRCAGTLRPSHFQKGQLELSINPK